MSPALMVISQRFFFGRLNRFKNIMQAKLYFAGVILNRKQNPDFGVVIFNGASLYNEYLQ